MKTAASFSLVVLACFTLVFSSGCAAQGPNLAETGDETPPSASPVQPQEEDFPEVLLDPSKLNEKAPAKFRVKFETNAGDFEIECTREWAPNGADRFYNMVKNGYFKNIYIFRAVKGFMFQFGIHGNPKVSAAWKDSTIKDDDPASGKPNTPGRISFAQAPFKNSRSCQMFVNLGDNRFLDEARGGGARFMPFGEIVSGKEIMNNVNTEYGENRRGDNVQGNFMSQGNTYIKEKFPRLTLIKSAKIVEPKMDKAPATAPTTGGDK